jgi:hypothetical protein
MWADALTPRLSACATHASRGGRTPRPQNRPLMDRNSHESALSSSLPCRGVGSSLPNMICRVSCLAVLLGWGAGLAPAAEPAKGPLDSLVNNSPFGSTAAPGAPAGPSQLEFRGVFTDQGEQFFSFFDPATRTSQWVSMKETGAPYTVQSYDTATQTVKVLFRNQPFTLTLKRAQVTVQALPAPQAPVAGPQPAAAPGAPAPAVGAPTSSDEAARLAQVAEEIRRRRALRAQGLPPQSQTPPVNPSAPTPQPAPIRP